MKIQELPEYERPYEKLELYGPEKLTNSELLAIIIKTGTKEETSIGLAQKILKMNKSEDSNDLKFLQDIEIEEFMQIKGIGKVKAIQLKAMCEITKRMSRPIYRKIKINSSQDAANLLMDEMKYEKREIVKLIILNTKNVVLAIKDVSLGGTNFAMIDPKEVLIYPIKMSAPNIILIHNHPSGDSTPSRDDIKVTNKIVEAANIIGINILDHIVIGFNEYTSIFAKIKK